MDRKNLLRNRLVAGLFLVFVIGFLVSIFVNSETKKTSELIQTKKGSWSLSEIIPNLREISDAFTDKNLKKGNYINPWGAFQRLTGNRYITSPDNRNVVRFKNGSLVWNDQFKEDVRDKAYEKWTTGMTRLKAYLDEKNIPLLYVQIPNKIDEEAEQYPAGFDSSINRFMDSTVSFVQGLGINTLDLRKEFAYAGADHYELFFKTDHHWTPEAALQGTRFLCEKLNKDYGYGIDLSLLSDQRMMRRTYSGIFLGSQGKRTGIFYSGVDDLTVIVPNYDTNFSCTYTTAAGKDVARNGDFEKAFIFRDRVSKVDYFAKNPYTVYSGSDYPETRYVNNNIKDRRILFVRDSFCCTMAPFFSLAACNELYTIDPRHDKQVLSKRIDEIRPDLVVFLNYVEFSKMDFFE